MENYELDYRKNIRTKCRSLALLNNQISTEITKSMLFKIKKNFKTIDLPMETLMNEIVQAVTERNKGFVSLDDSRLLALFGLFGLSYFQFKEHIK